MSGGSHEEPAPRLPLAIERILGAACMLALVGITFANVVTRYLTGGSLAFTEEYSVTLMVAIMLLGAGVAFAADRHIRITVLLDRLAPGPRRAAEVGVGGLCLLMLGLLVWLGGRMAWDAYRFEETSAGLGVPMWWYLVWLPVLALAAGLRVLGRILRVARS